MANIQITGTYSISLPGDVGSDTIQVKHGNGGWFDATITQGGLFAAFFIVSDGSVPSTVRFRINSVCCGTLSTPITVQSQDVADGQITGVNLSFNYTLGCMDASACNYNSSATASDNSCIYCEDTTCYDSTGSGSNIQCLCSGEECSTGYDQDPEYGCTDNNACNYDSNADIDNGTCEYPTSQVCYQDLDGDGYYNNADIQTVCDCTDLGNGWTDEYGSGEEINGCTDSTACNYNPTATQDAGCVYATTITCYQDLDDDGNYDSSQTITECYPTCPAGWSTSPGDGPEIPGCTDPDACNYNQTATEDDSSCYHPNTVTCYNTSTNAVQNFTGCNQTCPTGWDDTSDVGCTDPDACNYNSNANEDDGSCNYPSNCSDNGYQCGTFTDDCGNLHDCFNEIGGCDSSTCTGGIKTWYTCTSRQCIENTQTCTFGCNSGGTDCADNTSPIANAGSDQTYNIPHDGTPIEFYTFTLNGSISDIDHNIIGYQWVHNGTVVSVDDLTPTFTKGPGTYIYTLSVMDDAGATHSDSVTITINAEPNATPTTGSLIAGCLPNCIANPTGPTGVDIQLQSTGFSDPDEDTLTYNYTGTNGFSESNGGLNSTDEDVVVGTHTYTVTVADAYGASTTASNTITVIAGVEGCTDVTACNYGELANIDDNSCYYSNNENISTNGPDLLYKNCDESCISDVDDDGICDELEVSGCTDSTACNYNPAATDDDGNCQYPIDLYGVDYVDCDDNCLNDSDGDGVCDEEEVSGCTDNLACNYNSAATDDDGSCIQASIQTCYQDLDGDGLYNDIRENIITCDCSELPGSNWSLDIGDGIEEYGCTDSSALNYNPLATEDDGSCIYAHAINNVASTISMNELETYCEQFDVSNFTAADDFTLSVSSNNGNCVVSEINQGACNGGQVGQHIHYFDITALEINTNTDTCNITVTATNDNEVEYGPWSQTSTVTINSIIGDISSHTFSINEDGLQSIDLSDHLSGNSGNAITYYIATLPSHGGLMGYGGSISSGELIGPPFTYYPAPNWVGTDSFTWYIVDDDDPSGVYTGPNNAATITINVGAVNDGPEITNDTKTLLDSIPNIQEDGSHSTIVIATDIDNNSLTWSSSSTNIGLSFGQNPTTSGGSSALVITPNAAWCGTETVNITVSDGPLSDSYSFDVVVDCVHNNPAFDVLDVSFNESDYDGQNFSDQTITVTDGDPEHFDFQISINIPPGIILNNHTGTWSFGRVATINENNQSTFDLMLSTSAVANFSGTVEIPVSITDPTGNTTTHSYTATVIGVDDPPSFVDIGTLTIDEDSQNNQFIIYIDDIDTPAEDFIWTAPTHNNISFNLLDGCDVNGHTACKVLDITPNENYCGEINISNGVEVTYSGGAVYTESFIVNITCTNDAPTIANPGNQTLNEDFGTATISMQLSDVDVEFGNHNYGDIIISVNNSDDSVLGFLTYSINANGLLTLTFMSFSNINGTTTITITATDPIDASLSSTTEFDIIVTPINDPPELNQTLSDITINEGDPPPTIDLTGFATDPDGDAITYQASITQSFGYSLTGSGNGISWAIDAADILTITPDINWSGTVTIYIRPFDSNNVGATTYPVPSFDFTVIAVNDAPTIEWVDTQVGNAVTQLNGYDFYGVGLPMGDFVALLATISDVDTSNDNLTITSNFNPDHIDSIQTGFMTETAQDYPTANAFVVIHSTQLYELTEDVSTTITLTVSDNDETNPQSDSIDLTFNVLYKDCMGNIGGTEDGYYNDVCGNCTIPGDNFECLGTYENADCIGDWNPGEPGFPGYPEVDLAGNPYISPDCNGECNGSATLEYDPLNSDIDTPSAMCCLGSINIISCCTDLDNTELCDAGGITRDYCGTCPDTDWTETTVGEDISGCMDELAANYNPNATVESTTSVGGEQVSECIYTACFDNTSPTLDVNNLIQNPLNVYGCMCINNSLSANDPNYEITPFNFSEPGIESTDYECSCSNQNPSGHSVVFPTDGGVLSGPINAEPIYPLNSIDDSLGHQCVYFGCATLNINGYDSANYNVQNYNCGPDYNYSLGACCVSGDNKLEITPVSSFGISTDTFQFKAYNAAANESGYNWILNGISHDWYKLKIFSCSISDCSDITAAATPDYEYHPGNFFVERISYNDVKWETGFRYKFTESGYYKIVLKSSNTSEIASGDFYTASKILKVGGIIPIHPSIGYFGEDENPYLPYQGIDIPGYTDFTHKNSEAVLINSDFNLDKRPTLGVFYPHEIQYDTIDDFIYNNDIVQYFKSGAFDTHLVSSFGIGWTGKSYAYESPTTPTIDEPTSCSDVCEAQGTICMDNSDCSVIENTGKFNGHRIVWFGVDSDGSNTGMYTVENYTYDRNDVKSSCNYPIPHEVPSDDQLDNPVTKVVGNVICCCGSRGYNGEWEQEFIYDNFLDDSSNYNEKFFYWVPDADIRTEESVNSITAPSLFYYWDRVIHEEQYIYTTAPANVQFYFYPRVMVEDASPFEDTIKEIDPFELLDVMENFGDNWYVSGIDWGDGTFEEAPQQLNLNKVITHNYEKPGIYEITGDIYYGSYDYMMPFLWSFFAHNVSNVPYNFWEIEHATKKFKIFININESDISNDFTYLGSDGYTYIPYKETTPIIGGLSSNSIYETTIKRQLGYVDNNLIFTSPPFKNYYDALKTENSLAQIDDTKILPRLSNFTGSYYDNSVDKGLPGTVDYASDFDTEDNTDEIFKPKFKHFGELGDHLGYTDIAQIRYFNKPIPMYELLGFNTNLAGNPGVIEYWKNIIPEDYDVFSDRYGVGRNQLALDIILMYSHILGGSPIYTTIESFLQGIEIEDGYLCDPDIGCDEYWSGLIMDGINFTNVSDYITTNLGYYDTDGDASITVTDINEFVQNFLNYPDNDTWNTGNSQNWIGGYYYPVLPKINKYGRFDETIGLQNNNIPFGTPTRNWDEDDTEAPITNENYYNDFLLIDMTMDFLEQDVLEDNSGNKNIGMMVSDYRIGFDEITIEPSKGHTTKTMKIERTKGLAF